MFIFRANIFLNSISKNKYFISIYFFKAACRTCAPLEDVLIGETSRQCRYFKMKPLEGLKADEDDEFA